MKLLGAARRTEANELFMAIFETYMGINNRNYEISKMQ
jgi:hypothetical protein